MVVLRWCGDVLKIAHLVAFLVAFLDAFSLVQWWHVSDGSLMNGVKCPVTVMI